MQDKLSENIRKPIKLWKILKKLGLSDKKAPATRVCLNMKKELTFTPRRIANTFKKHFKNVASDVVKNLPDPTGKFRIPLVRQLTREFP